MFVHYLLILQDDCHHQFLYLCVADEVSLKVLKACLSYKCPLIAKYFVSSCERKRQNQIFQISNLSILKHKLNSMIITESAVGIKLLTSQWLFFSPPGAVLPAVGNYGTLPNTKTMGNISEHTVAHSIPTSPSHGSLALYSTFSPPRQQVAHNPSSSQSEVSSPVFRGDVTLDRHRTHIAKVEHMALDFDSNDNKIKLHLYCTFHTKIA